MLFSKTNLCWMPWRNNGNGAQDQSTAAEKEFTDPVIQHRKLIQWQRN